MVRNWLIEIRKKPKAARNRAALIAAASFTGIVMLIWTLTLPGQLKERELVEEGEGPRAFSTLWGQLKEQTAGVGDALPEAGSWPTSTTNSAQPVVLSATSTEWSLSSSTVQDKKIEREVPIIVVPSASSSVAASTTPSPQ